MTSEKGPGHQKVRLQGWSSVYYCCLVDHHQGSESRSFENSYCCNYAQFLVFWRDYTAETNLKFCPLQIITHVQIHTGDTHCTQSHRIHSTLVEPAILSLRFSEEPPLSSFMLVQV